MVANPNDILMGGLLHSDLSDIVFILSVKVTTEILSGHDDSIFCHNFAMIIYVLSGYVWFAIASKLSSWQG